MKKFTIPCDFNGIKAPFTIYIGDPEPRHHPIHFQADWLSKSRGGVVPQEVMDSIAKLKALSEKNNVSFEELCVYAIGSAQSQQDGADEDDSSNNESESSDDNDSSDDNEESTTAANK
jgi:Domain of unknown function (DUF2610)